MAEALSEFCKSEHHVTVHTTTFGCVTNLITEATPQQLFQKLLTANIDSHFTIIELDANNVPMITYSSAGLNIDVVESTDDIELDHAAIDESMTEDQLAAELNMYLDKVQENGLEALTNTQQSRLKHLSQL
jgi:hypothetical protein